jgi:uncharacterized protein
MARTYFLDAAPSALGKLERTPLGGYVASAACARAGVMTYAADAMRAQGLAVPADIPRGGVVRVYTPPSVLEAAVDSMRTAPVTDSHPRKMVDTSTFAQVCRGTVVSDTCRFEDGKLHAKLAIQDAGLLRAVELGEKREVSMGYFASTDFTPGQTPEGEAYDAIRTDITYNHVAIVQKGRAGPQVCLALDSEEIPTEEDTTVKFTLKIKGREVELDAAECQAQIDALEAELDVSHQAKEAAEKTAKEARDAAEAAVSDEAVEAAIVKREDARKPAEAKAAKRKAVADSGIDLEGKTDAYIDAAFDLIQKQAAEDKDDVALIQGRRGPKRPGDATTDAADKPRLSARQQMIARNKSAWRAAAE